MASRLEIGESSEEVDEFDGEFIALLYAFLQADARPFQGWMCRGTFAVLVPNCTTNHVACINMTKNKSRVT